MLLLFGGGRSSFVGDINLRGIGGNMSLPLLLLRLTMSNAGEAVLRSLVTLVVDVSSSKSAALLGRA